MSNARNLSKFKPSSSGLVETADIADGAITTAKITDANITTAKIADANITTSKVADDAVTGVKIENNPTIAGNLTVSGGFVPSTSYTNRNLMINGAMNVQQRANLTTAQSGFSLDRWSILSNSDARLTVFKDTNVPSGQGFLSSLKIDVTTADTSVASSHITALIYKFEGQDLQQLRKGTSSAKQLTLQFWVSSPKTGVHTLHFFDMANSRIVATTYTISSANTWQYVNVTFPADTTGALANDNTNQLQLYFGLNAGTNYTSGTLATSWASNTNANRMVGQVNTLDDVANNFYITGVQMELGEVATPFEFEKHADTLAKCQRYYCKSVSQGTSPGHGADATTNCVSIDMASNLIRTDRFFFPVEMRANPTVTCHAQAGVGGSSTGQWAGYISSTWTHFSFSGGNVTTNGFCGAGSHAGSQDGYAYWTHANWEAEAEL